MSPAALLLLASAALAAGSGVPPAPADHVTDRAGFLSPAARSAIDAKLAAVSGPQVVVWIGPAPESASVEEWAARTFEAWGVGTKGVDDGVAIFVFPTLRTVRIEVGYGLEGVLTDAVADRIIRERFVPAARAGDADAAVAQTVDAVLGTLGVAGAVPLPTEPSGPLPWWQLALYAVAGLALLILAITHPRLAFLMLLTLTGHGDRRSRGGGFGGFRGGGGRSGGGGATGTW